MGQEFIGAGWGFPLSTDPTGGIALANGQRDVEEAIRIILGTSYGERPMRPEFGCGIWEYVFSPSDATTAGKLSYEVRASLDRWEPRIDVVDVIVGVDTDDTSTLYIDICYRIKGANDPRNLVFPFYVIPQE